MSKFSVTVLPGDGIGPEVVSQAMRVLNAVTELGKYDFEIVSETLPVGLEAHKKHGSTLPDITRNALGRSDGCILGPLSTHLYAGPEMINVSAFLRKTRQLHANIRPVRSHPNTPCLRKDIDFVVVRENTEGFYADRNLLDGNGEMRINEDIVLSVRVVTRNVCEKLAEHAFRLARRRKRQSLVTAAHKANVLRKGCGLFLDSCHSVQKRYPDIKMNDVHIDALATQLVLRPQDFDVIVTTNMFGDIISDEAAGLVGGLGLAPGLNAGDKYAVAQATHGSAPDLAGRGIANPTAEILSVALLLDWLGETHGSLDACKASRAMEKAVNRALAAPSALTPDLGGRASTADLGNAVIQEIRRLPG